MRAGYLDEPEVTATEEERIEAAFQYVLSDRITNSVLGSGGETLVIEAKRGIVIVYETLTAKNY